MTWIGYAIVVLFWVMVMWVVWENRRISKEPPKLPNNFDPCEGVWTPEDDKAQRPPAPESR